MSLGNLCKISFSLEKEKDFINKFKGTQPDWGPLGYVVYKRTYARKIEPENPSSKTEEWWQTCQRVVNGTFSIQKNHCGQMGLPWSDDKAQRTAQRMFQAMWDFKFLPPGRGLWSMGTENLEKIAGMSLNNCGFVSTEDMEADPSKPFAFLMDCSMLGVGVGFDTLGAGKVFIQNDSIFDGHEKYHTYVIPDTREGWVESVRRLLNHFFLGAFHSNSSCEFDYSKIRPQGLPIRGFGGMSSGPKPLQELHDSIREQFKNRDGDLVSSTDIVDIQNLIGKCVVSGNVRRSAELALGQPGDRDFALLKQDSDKLMHHRWASNNSIMAVSGMDYDYHAELSASNGEPGYVWLENMQKYGRMGDPADNRDFRVRGANPCVTEDTLVWTPAGPKFVRDLIAHSFVASTPYGNLKSDDKSAGIGFFPRGDEKIYQIITKEGYELKCSADHRVQEPTLGNYDQPPTWIKVKDLKPGDKLEFYCPEDKRRTEEGLRDNTAWLAGLGFADGHFHEAHGFNICVWDQVLASKVEDVLQRKGHYIESRDETRWATKGVYRWFVDKLGIYDKQSLTLDCLMDLSIEEQWSFIGGLFDGDGSFQGNLEKGCSARIWNTNRVMLRAVQDVLSHLGIRSVVCKRRDAGKSLLPNGKGGWDYYDTKDQYELIISNASMVRFMTLADIRSSKRDKFETIQASRKRNVNHDSRTVTVQSVEDTGVIETVYDCNIQHGNHAYVSNGFVSHNCVEQSLESYELCCLVENFPSRHETLKDFCDTLKLAYLYAKTVTLVPTHWAETNSVLLRNRRIGCSQSGITNAFDIHGTREILNWCDVGYKYINGLDEQYSQWLCVPSSIKKTSVKPSGTISLLPPNINPGIHRGPSQYYIRRMRLSSRSEIVPALEAAGYHIEPAETSPEDTVVASFPVQDKTFTVAESDVSMWEQLEIAAQVQHYWADNSVSVTIKFRPEEASGIKNALQLYESRLKAVSFLPHFDHGYAQAPIESISKDEYDEMISKIDPDILYGSLNEETDGGKTLFCDSDKCEIVSN